MIKATGQSRGLELDNVASAYVTGYDTVQFVSVKSSGILTGDYTKFVIQGGSTVICKGSQTGYYEYGGGGEVYLQDNATLMAYGNPSFDQYSSALYLDSGIDLRYPVGAYMKGTHVYYAGTTNDVVNDWVVIGPSWAKIPPYLLAADYDLNGDGKISAGDIQIIINEMKKPVANQDMKYDLNGDGKISAGDIQIIINEMKK